MIYATSDTLILAANAQEAANEFAIIDTNSAVPGANWADTVTITIDENTNMFHFRSHGIPNHGVAEKHLILNDAGSQPFADNAPDEFTVVNSAEYFMET